MKAFNWSEDKNISLKQDRGIGFEEILISISGNGLLDILEHHNQARYPNQRIFVVRVKDYVYAVPFVENKDEIFLKTIIPSRKMKKKYLRG